MTKFSVSFILLMMACAVSGCSTIYFERGARSSRQLTFGEWHHDAVFGLVEVSDPVDMNQRCETKDWSAIKVEKTFVQGLVGMVTYSLYDPWDVSFSCKK